jgi:PQQ-dependent catabolism-associated CXXCW motif protein
MRMRASALALVGLIIVIPVHADDLPEGVDPATGYRMDNYRAPTPNVLPGGAVADFPSVKQAAAGKGSQLIDVYSSGAVSDPITGEWTNMDKRQQIPGSIWLPGVGSGALDKGQQAYFDRNLMAVTGGDKGRGLIFYCMSDCWQSWNAARRAIRAGYANVAWYPLGTDGWLEQGGKLVGVEPVNFLGSGS